MSRGGRGGQKIADLNRRKIGIHFAVHFAKEGNGFSVRLRSLLVEHNAGFVITGTGDDASDPLVVGGLARLQYPIVTQHHDSARLDEIRIRYVEVFGAVSIGEPNVPSYLDVALKE